MEHGGDDHNRDGKYSFDEFKSVVESNQGNSLRSIDRKTVRKERISICLLKFSSQQHKENNKETKWFQIAASFLYLIFSQKVFSEWKPLTNIVCKKWLLYQVEIKKPDQLTIPLNELP